jgi:hypothetical protein
MKIAEAGPGLSADKRARLFRPFDRLGAEQSEVQGTTFTVELPESSHRLLSGTPGRP